MKDGEKIKGYKYDKGRQSKHKTFSAFNNPKPYSSGGTPMKSYPQVQSLGSKVMGGLKNVARGVNNQIVNSLNNPVSSAANDRAAAQFGQQQRAGAFHKKRKATGKIKTTGKFRGKSNKLGHGGRAAQLKARGVPGGIIGELARAAHAAKGQKNYHGKHKTMATKKCKKHAKVACKVCSKKKK